MEEEVLEVENNTDINESGATENEERKKNEQASWGSR